MSLINQMLRDLEQRNNPPASANPLQPLDIQLSRPQPPSRHHVGWWLAGLMPLVGWLLWQSQQSNPTPATPPAVTHIQSTETTPTSNAPKVLEQPSIPLNAPIAEPIPVETHLSNAEPVVTPATQQLPDKPAQPPTANAAQKIKVNPASSPQKHTGTQPTNPSRRAEALYSQLDNHSSLLLRKESLRDVLQIDPRHLPARQAFLRILVQERSTLELKQFLDESLALFPHNLSFITTLAHYHIQQKNFAAAIDTLERLDNYTINDTQYLALLAGSYQQQLQFAKALPIYQKLSQLQPEKAENWLGLGICAEKQQLPGSAAQAYQLALDKNTLNKEVVDYINQRLSILPR